MFGRFFSLLLLLLCGATLGYFWAQSQELHAAFYLVVGGLVGAMLWWFWDAIRGLRVVYWLRYGNLAEVPSTFGLWGTVVDRTRRLLRERERAINALRVGDAEKGDFVSIDYTATLDGTLVLITPTILELT